jgi:hypothetical protein
VRAMRWLVVAGIVVGGGLWCGLRVEVAWPAAGGERRPARTEIEAWSRASGAATQQRAGEAGACGRGLCAGERRAESVGAARCGGWP